MRSAFSLTFLEWPRESRTATCSWLTMPAMEEPCCWGWGWVCGSAWASGLFQKFSRQVIKTQRVLRSEGVYFDVGRVGGLQGLLDDGLLEAHFLQIVNDLLIHKLRNMIDDTNYKKLVQKKMAKKPLSENPESRYWSSFKPIHSENMEATIKCVCSDYNARNLMLFTQGDNVITYDPRTKQVIKKQQRFKSKVFSLAIRQDGQVLAAGLENGKVNVFTLKDKLPIRIFKNFAKPVYSVQFSTKSFETLYGASDEGILKQFDIAGDKVVRSFANAHSDFIRCIRVLDNDHVLSSGYDGMLKVFDFRCNSKEAVKVFGGSDPVEAVEVLRNGWNFVSGQDTKTALWDLRSGKVQEMQVNQKSVTCLSRVSYREEERIVSGSLDQQVKWIRSDIFEVSHQVKWGSPLVGVACSADSLNLILGGSDGSVEVRQRGGEQLEEEHTVEDEDYIPQYLKENPYLKKRIRNFEFFNRGIYKKSEHFDVKVDAKEKPQLGVFDKLLVRFEYKEAMLTAFRERQSSVVVSLCDELIARGCLQVAFKNLTQEELHLVQDWLTKKLCNAKYQQYCLIILKILIDLEYNIENERVQRALSEEVSLEQELIEMKGMLQCLMQY